MIHQILNQPNQSNNLKIKWELTTYNNIYLVKAYEPNKDEKANKKEKNKLANTIEN